MARLKRLASMLWHGEKYHEKMSKKNRLKRKTKKKERDILRPAVKSRPESRNRH